MRNDNYTVFEAINEKRREIFVGATPDPMFETIAWMRRERPGGTRDWNFDDVKNLRSIEFHLTEAQARAFIAEYVKSGLPPGWKYLFDGSVRGGVA